MGHGSNAGVANPVDEGRDDAENALRCLGCGEYIIVPGDVGICFEDGCLAGPFHAECLETHYRRQHPRPRQAKEEKDKTKEEEILQREADDARTQWADQMTKLSKIAMPFSRRIASMVVALISVALAVEPFWSSAAADAPVSLLQ